MTTQGPDYTSKTDLVAALIRELIITGELATGEQLRQRDLAQRFSVSQTPVREAMRRLEAEGLLRILAALAEGDSDAASARTYQHIMDADPVKEVSG